jgi:hypothetical protein
MMAFGRIGGESRIIKAVENGGSVDVHGNSYPTI